MFSCSSSDSSDVLVLNQSMSQRVDSPRSTRRCVTTTLLADGVLQSFSKVVTLHRGKSRARIFNGEPLKEKAEMSALCPGAERDGQAYIAAGDFPRSLGPSRALMMYTSQSCFTRAANPRSTPSQTVESCIITPPLACSLSSFSKNLLPVPALPLRMAGEQSVLRLEVCTCTPLRRFQRLRCLTHYFTPD